MTASKSTSSLVVHPPETAKCESFAESMAHTPLYPAQKEFALGILPDNPLVSIIVPSYNQGRFIRATIDSILSQDYRPLRIHVIDGASGDETLEVLKSFGDIPELDWISEPDKGVVEAVNKGFGRATGDIIAIQSSDDCYLPGSLKTVVENFRSNKSVGLVYGDTIKVDAAGREMQRSAIGPWSLENWFLLKTWIPQPSCFFRRELLEACGGWDESIQYAADTDLWLRMVFRTDVLKLDQYLSQRRMHDQQRDQHSDRIYRDYCQMIKRSPDVASAPRSLKRAAQAGCHLLYRRYNPSGSIWKALGHDLRAMLIQPKSVSFERLWGHGVVIPARIFLQPLAPLKRWLGCWMHERIRAEVALSPWLSRLTGYRWVELCNRHEQSEPGDSPEARYVKTEFTSYLTVARQFPRVGGRLAKLCFRNSALPALSTKDLPACESPRVSVIIPVGGSDRLSNFNSVLACFQNQTIKNIEIIVLEHSYESIYHFELPTGVRYQHVPMHSQSDSFNKSHLFNLGVGMAQSSIVLLHDADILVPANYLEKALAPLAVGFEAIRPIRFFFYLDKEASEVMKQHSNFHENLEVAEIAQNAQGGSTFLTADVYRELGGHDERFEGWGGEDLEFLERLVTRKLFKGGMMPALHLWHQPADEKIIGDKNHEVLKQLQNIPPKIRADALVMKMGTGGR